MPHTQFLPQLLSVDFSADSVWSGEKLYVKTTWQSGNGVADFTGKVCLTFQFYSERQLRSNYDDLKFDFTPYPHIYNWKEENVYTVGGGYRIPSVWGGSRKVYLTLLDDEEMPVPFIGSHGEIVRREYVGQIEFAWHRPSDKVLKRIRPVHTVFALASSQIKEPTPKVFTVGKMEFCRDYPGIYRYDGEPLTSYVPRIVLRDVDKNCMFSDREWNCSLQKVTDREIRYRLTGDKFALELVFYPGEEEVTLSLECVEEAAGIELISVEYPHLLALGGEGNYLVDFFATGRLVNAHKSWQMGCAFPFDVDNFAGMYNTHLCVALSASSMDTILSHSIEGTAEAPLTVLGAKLHYKVASAQKGGLSLPVKAKIHVRLQFAKCGDWQTIARMLRKGLTPKYDPVYRNALVAKWMLDDGMGKADSCYSLEQVREHVRMLSELTDHLPQIIYLVGWQKGGHDVGYPSPEGVNAGIGSREVLQEVIRECREKYNTLLSFHDNFDDAYLENDFDHSLIARDAYGDLCKGWMWSGGQSHILSPKRYVTSGVMAERVKKQVEQYGITGSYHIDVLSSEVRRYDFSPDMMAAADENFEYKKKIVEEFASYGVDVTSEVLAVPLVGQMSYTWHIRDDGGKVFMEEEMIPLSAMLYHGVAGYNMPSGCSEKAILRAMMHGAQSVVTDMTGYKEEEIFAYYILSIPIRQFAMMEIERYEFSNGRVRAVYGPDSFIEVNLAENTYTMQLHGRVLGKDWVTMVPTGEDVCLAYARTGATYTFLLPEGWENARAVQLTKNGMGDAIETLVADNRCSLLLPAGIPVKLMRV